MANPSACAAEGERSRSGTPPISTVPESGTVEPAATAINVDFPAPFSPTSACTSPASTSNVTPLSATTPGNVLTTSSRRRTTAGVSATALYLAALAVRRDRRDAELVVGIEVRRRLRVAL